MGEEKSRVDTMAEGLEEESQKALQMESDLEKNLALFDSEKSQLKAQLQREEVILMTVSLATYLFDSLVTTNFQIIELYHRN